MTQIAKLDRKDLEIINALFKYGFGSSSRFISEKIKIPDRTISYRLKALKEKGLLRIYPFTNERRLGLGDCIIAMQESEKCKASQLYELLKSVPYFYLFSPTYGKYNGLLCFAIYSLESTHPKEYLEKLRMEGLITDYCIYDIRDHIISDPKLEFYDPQEGRWKWDWKKWEEIVNTTIQCKHHSENLFENLHLEDTPKISKFDEIDIKLLKTKKYGYHVEKVTLSNSELGKRLNLSGYQVRRRIQRLYDQGVLLGPLMNFYLPGIHDVHFIYLFIKIKDTEKSSKVLSLFCELPHQVGIFVESISTAVLYYRMRAEEFTELLRGFELLKSHLESYFFQILPFYYDNRHHLYTAYNKDTNSWETPLDEYLELIEKFKENLS
ncbi:MAG: winged helix-turn-helix transcriptional regulator [Promethearchaeota archaeon]